MVASSRFPIVEPFAGGLEAHTHTLVLALRARGHRVMLFAGPGSDPVLGADLLDVPQLVVSESARRDVAAPPQLWMQEHHAYLGLMLALAARTDVDMVHNNSLHHLPVAMASTLRVPVVTTLHTPPLPWLESAVALAPKGSSFISVSDATRRSWAHAVPSTVVHNGVDTDFWGYGTGGERAVWSGRLVPEKAPHLALDAARRAGLTVDLYGPLVDAGYFAREVAPRLGPDATYGGHLDRRRLRARLQRAAVALVTPVWEEPFGLVAAEAMSTGTPVAAFDRGALGEVVGSRGGCLARADDVDDLALAIRGALALPRPDVRRYAQERYGIEAMVDGYEAVYDDLVPSAAS
ncbi:glycosyltransferase [Nocardioides mangrovicus]|uniref:glycosyltransferase n=1 Tax=Nocardioides mangrovicus TaxID=2478913 RepID=UPI001E485758|nr:glycosyltransferase [Nocardioides mangrovicus]